MHTARHHTPALDLQSVGLLVALAATAAFAGLLAFGVAGLFVAVIGVLLLGIAGIKIPAPLIMRVLGARPLLPWQSPGLYRLTRGLAARAGITPPTLFLVDAPEANAIAVGDADDDAAIAVTTGLLVTLHPRGLAGVLAHETAHLARGDGALQTIAGIVGRTAGWLLTLGLWVTFVAALIGHAPLWRLALLGAASLVIPVLLQLILAALSRTREHAADELAARLTGDPLGLASALWLLERTQGSWIAQLLGQPRTPDALRSHPDTAERVRRLQVIARAMQQKPSSTARPSRPLG